MYIYLSICVFRVNPMSICVSLSVTTNTYVRVLARRARGAGGESEGASQGGQELASIASKNRHRPVYFRLPFRSYELMCACAGQVYAWQRGKRRGLPKRPRTRTTSLCQELTYTATSTVTTLC